MKLPPLGEQSPLVAMVMVMKKVDGLNWISAARSVSPAIHVPYQARSATLAPRPRFAARTVVSEQIAAG